MVTPDLTDNDLVTPLYDFDNPIYHAEEEGEEDCDLLELARLLKQEEKVIQPHEERFKIVTPSSTEVRKQKLRPTKDEKERRCEWTIKMRVELIRKMDSRYITMRYWLIIWLRSQCLSSWMTSWSRPD